MQWTNTEQIKIYIVNTAYTSVMFALHWVIKKFTENVAFFFLSFFHWAKKKLIVDSWYCLLTRNNKFSIYFLFTQNKMFDSMIDFFDFERKCGIKQSKNDCFAPLRSKKSEINTKSEPNELISMTQLSVQPHLYNLIAPFVHFFFFSWTYYNEYKH